MDFGDAWFPIRAGDDDAMIARYEAAGVTRSVYMLRPGDAADAASAERKLDEWASRIEGYRGCGPSRPCPAPTGAG